MGGNVRKKIHAKSELGAARHSYYLSKDQVREAVPEKLSEVESGSFPGNEKGHGRASDYKLGSVRRQCI